MDQQPRISLCVIAGNESAHITRLLDSFAPAFDELSLVIATGSVEPDDTLDLAAKWCEAHSKEFVGGYYTNKREHAWPHVDNFAAARNISFANATGDWLFWADCDDVLINPEAVRAQATDDADMVQFPYDVTAAGKVNIRERLIRRTKFHDGHRWQGAVHEVIPLVAGERCRFSTAAVWKHDPIGPKAGGKKRNLRILTAELERAPEYYYYVHQDYFYLGHKQNAERFGHITLSLPGLPDVLKFQVLLNMCQLADLKEDARSFALRAWYLFPNHREALASLIRCAFQDEKPEQALRFAWIMESLPEPTLEARQWWHEPRWYGWASDDLIRRAERYAGHVCYEPYLTPAISLVHATRGRISKAIATREAWLSAADDPYRIQHVFAIDADDADGKRWLKQFEHVATANGNSVSAWNEGAKAATADILVQLSDDWEPVQGWDTKILAEFAGIHGPAVLAINDGLRDDGLLCMAILNRARYAQQGGEMFSSEYESVYSDNEFTHRAYRDGVVINARDRITFKHDHPLAKGGEGMDEVYRKSNSEERYTKGRETFLRRNPEASL
jgi:glycosyltransferase involved in cell wall biosynthesis